MRGQATFNITHKPWSSPALIRINAWAFLGNMGDLVIVTYGDSFDQHEKSHADKLFNEHFSKLADFCDATFEVGYEMFWQGVPEDE